MLRKSIQVRRQAPAKVAFFKPIHTAVKAVWRPRTGERGKPHRTGRIALAVDRDRQRVRKVMQRGVLGNVALADRCRRRDVVRLAWHYGKNPQDSARNSDLAAIGNSLIDWPTASRFSFQYPTVNKIACFMLAGTAEAAP